MKNLSNIVKGSLSVSLAAVAFMATPSFAATPVVCANTDISFKIGDVTKNASDCRGFVFNNEIGSTTSEALLAQLGYTGPAKPGIETLTNLGGLKTVNFGTLLFGDTVIGIHYGNGEGAPGGQGQNGDGDDTAFYRFDAGTTGLDTFTLNFGASSNARLYKTGVGAVPEPATWMFMLLGMTGIGFTMRRKDKQTLRVRYT